jgi:hypothetical protein
MFGADGHLGNNLPTDKLDSVVLGQNARIDHLLVFVDANSRGRHEKFHTPEKLRLTPGRDSDLILLPRADQGRDQTVAHRDEPRPLRRLVAPNLAEEVAGDGSPVFLDPTLADRGDAPVARPGEFKFARHPFGSR